MLMPTFTPPTYTQGFLPERKDDWSLMRWYDFEVAYSVLIESGVASTYPGEVSPSTDRIKAADAAFIGGRVHTVTAGEQTILEAAGYTVNP